MDDMRKFVVSWPRSLFCLMATTSAWAKADEPLKPVKNLDQVVVVGTHRTDTTALQSTAPIDVIDGADLAKTGATTLNQALFQALPSFNFPQNQGATRGQDPKGASLRGLSPDQTLVLVNGKRRHASAVVSISSGVPYLGAQAVDLGMIPVSAIERVEVLRDGASAQYGSDAVAGVINIVLKARDHGGGLGTEVGKYGQGDGFSKSTSGWYGLKLPGEGFLTLSFDTLDARPTDIGDPNGPDYRWGGASRSKYNLGFNAEIGLSDEWRLYGFGTYGHDGSVNNVPQLLADADANVRGIYPNGSVPRYRYSYSDLSATLGARYEDENIGSFDLSATYGSDQHHERAFDTVNASLGLASPTAFDVGRLGNEQSTVSLDYLKNLAVSWSSRPLTLSAGAAYRYERYRVGPGDYASWVNGGQPILDGPDAGQAAPVGAYQAGGIQPLDAGSYTRHVQSIYADLEQQLTDKFQWGLAGRYEKYSDIGEARTGKLSLRYDFTPRVALRFTANNAYRAPTLGQIGTSWTTTTNTDGPGGINLSTRILPVGDPAARALGARALRPEKSMNYSLGLVLRPSDLSSVTVDAYQIAVRRRITLSSFIGSTQAQQILAAAGYPQYSGAQFFINSTDTRTRGVDIVARQEQALDDGGRLDWSAAYSYHQTWVTHVAASPYGFPLVGHDQIGYLERGYPRDKAIFSVAYAPRQDWHFILRETRYGSYAFYSPFNPEYDQIFPAQWSTDLDLNHSFTKHFTLSIGANNLFDSQPKHLRQALKMTPVQYYAFLSPTAPEGVFYYIRAAYEF